MRRFRFAMVVLAAGLAAGSGTVADDSEAGHWLVAPVPFDVAAVFEAPKSEWGPGHRGIDLFAAVGGDVFSPGAGIVTFAGTVAGRGVVVIRHQSGLRSSLEPVNATVTEGEAVRARQPIGAVAEGASHCAPRACVHWGVRKGDVYVDPLDVLVGFGPIRLLPLR